MRLPALFFIILSGAWSVTAGQDGPDGKRNAETISFRIRSINFLKNNEYSGPLTEGYTLAGYFFQPEICYSPSEKLSLSLGTHLLRYSGTGKFSVFRPLFSAAYNFTPGGTLILGTLMGSGSHRMFDPHFSKERIYANWSEEGLQLNYSGVHIYNDTWLSWENFIFRGDTVREVFTAGESLRYSSALIDDFFRFEIPLQIKLKHFGGQISDYPEPVETFFNLATGAKISFHPASGRYGVAGFEYSLFISDELTGRSTVGLSFGHAEWFRLNYEYRRLCLEAGFWMAGDFYAPDGNPLFGSVSDYGENTIINERRLATLSVGYTIKPEKFFELYIGADLYYDTRLKRTDSSAALHLKFDRLFGRSNSDR